MEMTTVSAAPPPSGVSIVLLYLEKLVECLRTCHHVPERQTNVPTGKMVAAEGRGVAFGMVDGGEGSLVGCWQRGGELEKNAGGGASPEEISLASCQ
jgi:hypothetical protein